MLNRKFSTMTNSTISLKINNGIIINDSFNNNINVRT